MKQTVVLLGSGRVATQLARRLEGLKGYEISQVYSRNISHATDLCQKLGSVVSPIDSLQQIKRDASLYIFALSDRAISTIASQMPPTNGIWLHTAGSISVEALELIHPKSGVLYPLQTFSLGREMDWSQVDLYIEAKREDVSAGLTKLANDLGGRVYYATSSQRQKLHLAAVFACNFANHLWALMESYLDQEGLPPKALLPLILETSHKITEMPAVEAQTGPALRGDTSTLEGHLKLLEAHPQLSLLYRLFSQSIQERHSSLPSSSIQ